MEDQFGRDPQVQHLRRVFAQIEMKQDELLQRLGVSPSDYRLRRVREATLMSFEKAWMIAGRRGVAETEDEIADLYILCMAKVLAGNRIVVPDDLLPANRGISDVVKEIFQ